MRPTVSEKELLRAFIVADRLNEVANAVAQQRPLFKDLYRLLYDPSWLIRHRAALVMGNVVRSNPHWAREVLERLLWAINDESGNHCPGAAGAIAEVALANWEVGKGFVPPLLALLEEGRGTPSHIELLWAIGLLAPRFKDTVSASIPTISKYLDCSDPLAVALAARALIRLGASFDNKKRDNLLANTSEVSYPEQGYLVTRTVRQVVLHESLAVCCSGDCKTCF